MFKQLLIAFSFFVIILPACGQTANPVENAAISQPFRDDLAALRKGFETYYPSLYRFKDKRSIDQAFDSCSRAINGNTTPAEFYGMIKFLIAQIGDGHMSCNPSQSLRDQFQQQWKYFPLSLVFVGESVYSNCNYAQITRGSEIMTINKKPVSIIKEKLFRYIAGDGNITTGKNYVLNNQFWFYYNLAYGEQALFEVSYKTAGGDIREAKLEPQTRKNISCENLSPVRPGKLLQLDFPAAGVALLTIRSFSEQQLSGNNENFNSFLENSFDEIRTKKIANLVIDVRDNGGGADVFGSMLYSYLADSPFDYYSKLERVNQVLTIADHSNLALQQPNGNSYRGKVYILVNGRSFSATTEFCAIARSKNRAVFIGEETGGAFIGNTSGGNTNFTLPNTQHIVGLPVIKYTMAVSDASPAGRGIIPDHILLPTISDIIAGKDVQLDYALKLTSR